MSKNAKIQKNITELSSEELLIRRQAAKTIQQKTLNIANHEAISAGNAIPALVQLLKETDSETKAAAAYALYNLASNNPDNMNAIIAAGGRNLLVRFINNHNTNTVTAAQKKKPEILNLDQIIRDCEVETRKWTTVYGL